MLTSRPAIEALIATTAARAQCPTISWGISLAGEWVMTGSQTIAGAGAIDGAGTAVAERRQVYRIASMTKSFTAATVLALRDDGLLRLDDPIAAVAPDLAPVRSSGPAAAEITIRHLLTMTSGLATDDAWADRHLDITVADLVALYAGGLRFAAEPGICFEYSNLGYSMLGRVIHAVTGELPQRVTTERLLEPLGLDDTTWVAPSDDRWARPFRLLDGRLVADAAPLGDGAIAPMGGLWSTLDDLRQWAWFLASAMPGFDPVAPEVLSVASRREMQHPHTFCELETVSTADGYREISSAYGYGLHADTDPVTGRAVYHTGGLPGYGSNMRWLPAHGIGLFALGNVTYAPMQDLTRRIVDILAADGVLARRADEGVTDALQAAGSWLIALLNAWGNAPDVSGETTHTTTGDTTGASTVGSAVNALFADNVALDEPLGLRARAAAAVIAEHGTLTVRRVEAERATRGTVHALAADGTRWHIRLELAPHAPLIQLYTVEEGPS